MVVKRDYINPAMASNYIVKRMLNDCTNAGTVPSAALHKECIRRFANYDPKTHTLVKGRVSGRKYDYVKPINYGAKSVEQLRADLKDSLRKGRTPRADLIAELNLRQKNGDLIWDIQTGSVTRTNKQVRQPGIKTPYSKRTNEQLLKDLQENRCYSPNLLAELDKRQASGLLTYTLNPPSITVTDNKQIIKPRKISPSVQKTKAPFVVVPPEINYISRNTSYRIDTKPLDITIIKNIYPKQNTRDKQGKYLSGLTTYDLVINDTIATLPFLSLRQDVSDFLDLQYSVYNDVLLINGYAYREPNHGQRRWHAAYDSNGQTLFTGQNIHQTFNETSGVLCIHTPEHQVRIQTRKNETESFNIIRQTRFLTTKEATARSGK